MMNKIFKRLSATSTWAASSDLTPVDLPRDGLITEITIRFAVTATLTATAVDDWFRRILQNIKIEGDGGRAYLGMSGTQMSTILSLWNEAVAHAPTLMSNGAGIALSAPDVGSTTFTSVFKFHPGSFKNDPFDTSVVIPAAFLSMLQAKLTTTAAAVTDAAGNITAGTIYYEVAVVQGNTRELKELAVMSPVGSTLVYTHTANYSDFSYDIDVPGGAYLRSIIMRVTDDTATVPRRKNDEVTGMKLKKPKSGDFVFEQTIVELQHAMAQRFGFSGTAGDVGPIGAIATIRPAPASLLSMLPAGFVIVDMRMFGHPVYGLDLRGFQTGDLKLGLTIANFAAGDATTIYWDQLLPIYF
jgi:hypothetical protein